MRFYRDERRDYPPFPENYFNETVRSLFNDYALKIKTAKASGREAPPFPEAEILEYLDITWRDSAKAVFNNWLGKVYQITNQDRRLPFMEGIDPDNPLGL
jgi:homoserine O-succinyltransferase